MRLRTLVITLALALSLEGMAMAAGSVQQTGAQQIGNTAQYVLSFYWTGDSADGSVPVTRAQFANLVQGYKVVNVETVPGSPTPTNNLSLQVLDTAGVDILGGAATSVSNTSAQSFAGSPTVPPIFGGFSISITGNSVAGAKGTVLIYLAPLTQVLGLSPSAPSFPAQGPNLVYASPDGVSGSPGFRHVASGDVPPINLASGTNGGVTGVLPKANYTPPAWSDITGPKQGNTNVPQMAGTNSGVAGAPLCNDGSGNAGTSGCNPGFTPPAGSPTQVFRIQPNTGNSTTYQFANLPTLQLNDYNWATQTPGGSITGGQANTVTMTPCPLGYSIASTPTSSPTLMYVSGGPGAAEWVTPTGGTCTPGAASGTVTFNATNSHSGAWTISPGAAGLQEVVNVGCAAGGATIVIPAGTFTLHATVTVPCNAMHFQGGGKWQTLLYRTEDYGDTFVLGSTSVGSVQDIQFIDLKMTYDMGYTLNGSGQITGIARHPTIYPNSAHVRAYGCINCHITRSRLEDMPYNFISDGGAYSSIEWSEFQGLWDYTNAAMQVTKASVYLTGDATPHGSTQGFYILDSNFFGFNSIPRSVTVNGSPFTQSENIGPQYMILADYVEVLEYKGGLNGGGGVGVLLNPVTFGISGLSITGVHFDGNRVANFKVDNGNSATGNVVNLEFTGNDVQGSGNTMNNFVVAPSTGITPLSAATVTGNMFSSTMGSAISLSHGSLITIAANSIRNYNSLNAYATHGGASAINVASNASYVTVGVNQYGSGTYDIYGLTIDNGCSTCSIAQGNNAGLTGAGFDAGLGHSPALFVHNPNVANELLKLGQEVAVSGAASMSCLNDAQTTNVPCEFRGTKYVFAQGPVAAAGVNYIASETGANNAIAGTLSGVSLTQGITVTIKLAHTLQAGANTFAYNGGGAVAIKSSRNVANNIAVAYASGGTITLQYDGAEWVDMSQ